LIALLSFFSVPQTVLHHCNVFCGCTHEGCRLKRPVHGLGVRLGVRHTTDKGWGVYAQEPLRKGQYVSCYLGEYLKKDEADRRYTEITSTGGMGDFQLTTPRAIIDATLVGNVSRLFNHSCAPNLCMKMVRVHSMTPRTVSCLHFSIMKGAYNPGVLLCRSMWGTSTRTWPFSVSKTWRRAWSSPSTTTARRAPRCADSPVAWQPPLS
jgi:hypothetical protein